MNAIELNYKIKTLPDTLQTLIIDQLKPSENKLISIDQIAFESEHKAYIHFVKNGDKSFFIYSKLIIKQTAEDFEESWTSKSIGVQLLTLLVAKSCFYLNTERTKTLSTIYAQKNFPHMEMKLALNKF